MEKAGGGVPSLLYGRAAAFQAKKGLLIRIRVKIFALLLRLRLHWVVF
jgi:hypothetical protein